MSSFLSPTIPTDAKIRKRVDLLNDLQVKILLQSFQPDNLQCDVSQNQILQQYFQNISLDYFNELLLQFDLKTKIIQIDENIYELTPTTTTPSDEESGLLLDKLNQLITEKLILLTSEEFLEFVNSLKIRIQYLLHQILQHEKIYSIDFLLTGGEGYTGDFMIEYEINPAAAVTTIYWPDVTKFTTEHIVRFTLGHVNNLIDVNIFGLLTDFPHEIGHILQNIYLQHIENNFDDGWLAEHDPSVLSLNLLSESLKLTHFSDEFSLLPYLFHSCHLWLSQRTHHYHYHESINLSHLYDYHRWKSSCGYVHPTSVEAASIAADYLKIRAALESYPINLTEQLQELFIKRTECNVRDEGYQPLLGYCHSIDVYPLPTDQHHHQHHQQEEKEEEISSLSSS